MYANVVWTLVGRHRGGSQRERFILLEHIRPGGCQREQRILDKEYLCKMKLPEKCSQRGRCRARKMRCKIKVCQDSFGNPHSRLSRSSHKTTTTLNINSKRNVHVFALLVVVLIAKEPQTKINDNNRLSNKTPYDTAKHKMPTRMSYTRKPNRKSEATCYTIPRVTPCVLLDRRKPVNINTPAIYRTQKRALVCFNQLHSCSWRNKYVAQKSISANQNDHTKHSTPDQNEVCLSLLPFMFPILVTEAYSTTTKPADSTYHVHHTA